MQPKSICSPTPYFFNNLLIACMKCHSHPSMSCCGNAIKDQGIQLKPTHVMFKFGSNRSRGNAQMEGALIKWVMGINQSLLLLLGCERCWEQVASVAVEVIGLLHWFDHSSKFILFLLINSESAYGPCELAFTLPQSHFLTHTHTQWIFRLLSSWFTLLHKVHTATQLTATESGSLWNRNNRSMLVWGVKLSLCFCFCSRPCLHTKQRCRVWHQERGF